MTKFENSNGTLTRYALACGYIETHDVAGRYQVRLSMVGGGGEYHVQVWDERLTLGMAAWEAYTTLTEARKAVAQAKKFYKGRKDDEAVERDTSPYGVAPWL